MITKVIKIKMYKKFLIVCLLVIATFEIDAITAATNRGTSSRGKYATYESSYSSGRRGYYGGQMTPMELTQSTQTQPIQTPKEYLDEKSGFSTFGIIAIIFVIIVCCLAFYYAVMCYPLLCGHEKKYRYMSDISSTITAATSRSIQSIENYPNDQKQQSCI